MTYHCPGQLVIYPMFDLGYYKKDLHWFLRQLEEVVLRVLRRYGLEGNRDPDNTGVWHNGVKLAAIGLGVRRWITYHGVALNVDCDLAGFDHIIPCGIESKGVGSLATAVGHPVSMDVVSQQVLEELKEIFNLDYDESSARPSDKNETKP